MIFNWTQVRNFSGGIGLGIVAYLQVNPIIPPIPPPVAPYDLAYFRRWLQDTPIEKSVPVLVSGITYPDCGYLSYIRRWLQDTKIETSEPQSSVAPTYPDCGYLDYLKRWLN